MTDTDKQDQSMPDFPYRPAFHLNSGILAALNYDSHEYTSCI